MATRTLQAQQISDPVCAGLGEGPVWDQATGVLHLVDLEQGTLLTAGLDGDDLPRLVDVRRREVGPVLACVRPRAGGGLALAGERAFGLIDPAPGHAGDPGEGDLRWFDPLWDNPAPRQGHRFNDGGCDTRGRFWCGAMSWDAAEGQGSMWRLDPSGAATRVEGEAFAGISVSNGLSFTPDGTRAFYADSASGRLDVLDVDPDSGDVTARRVFAELSAATPVGDGLTLDADGGVWLALWKGGRLHRYDPAGRLDVVVEFPVTYVTCPAFVGPDLDVLVATTSQRDLAPGAEAGAGAVFAVRPGVRGLPVLPFAG